MTNSLNIKDEPIFDDRIVKIETHMYNPFANTTFGYSDEIEYPYRNRIYTHCRTKAFYTSREN